MTRLLNRMTALEGEPNDVDLHTNRGASLSALGDKIKSDLEEYDKALLVIPGFTKALINKGNALSAMKKYEDAIESYNKVIQNKPTDFKVSISEREFVSTALDHMMRLLNRMTKL